jgi:hypothetical protein
MGEKIRFSKAAKEMKEERKRPIKRWKFSSGDKMDEELNRRKLKR